jgi:acetoin utilization deacetylase AcuC-like enzyme
MQRIPVYYDDRMVAESHSFSPSAAKPAKVVASWQRFGFPVELRTPRPAGIDQLCGAHHPAYVIGVLEGRISNGFGNRRPEIAASLPWTSGAMVDAALEAVRNGIGAVAPASGFHHACYEEAGGYCTFNGLVVAAREVRRKHPQARVGILDFDMHYGNGTAQILRQLKLDWVAHYSAAADYERPEQAERFLAQIPAMLRAFEGCSVLLYQAGADPHINDPLGGWLDSRQLAVRDRRVFQLARMHGLPVAWNLAGGYQEPISKVLAIHDATMRECVTAWCEAPTTRL